MVMFPLMLTLMSRMMEEIHFSTAAKKNGSSHLNKEQEESIPVASSREILDFSSSAEIR